MSEEKKEESKSSKPMNEIKVEELISCFFAINDNLKEIRDLLKQNNESLLERLASKLKQG